MKKSKKLIKKVAKTNKNVNKNKTKVVTKSHDSIEVVSAFEEAENLKTEIENFIKDLENVNQGIEEMASVVASRTSVTNTPMTLGERKTSISYMSNPLSRKYRILSHTV